MTCRNDSSDGARRPRPNYDFHPPKAQASADYHTSRAFQLTPSVALFTIVCRFFSDMLGWRKAGPAGRRVSSACCAAAASPAPLSVRAAPRGDACLCQWRGGGPSAGAARYDSIACPACGVTVVADTDSASGIRPVDKSYGNEHFGPF